MKKRKNWMFVNLFILAVLPYVITILINGSEMALLNRTADPEIILPIILKEQISSDYEEETLKAQAVIARSNLFRKLKNKNEMEKEYKKLQEKNSEKLKICVFMDKKEQKFEDAVKSTKGQILTFNGEVKLVPYHEISAGQTRNGEIAFHDSEYAYLKGVDSSADKAASDYFNSVYINRQQLPEELKVKEREESGYVVSLMADKKILEAEAFAKGMKIPSSDFSIQKVGNLVRFLSKGKGHGIGFSQYGGNEMAKEGKNWKEILNTYFPLMEITAEDFL